MVFGGPAGLDDHHVGIEGADSQRPFNAGDHGLVGQDAMGEQDPDEGPGALLVTEATPRRIEEAVVRRAEAPRGPGLMRARSIR